MKLFKLFALAILATVAFTSCSDDDNGPGSKEDLIGTWETVTYTFWYKENGQIIDGSETEEEDDCTRFVFNDDGTLEVYERANSTSSWKLDETANYKYSGGKISINLNGAWIPMTVKKLDRTTLVFESHLKYKNNGVNCEEYQKATCRRISNTQQ